MDTEILLWINHSFASPFFDGLFAWVSNVRFFSAPMLLLMLVWIWRQQGRSAVLSWVMLLMVIFSAEYLSVQSKEYFAQPRPCYDIFAQLRAVGGDVMAFCQGSANRGMPSSHAAGYAAAALFLIVATRWHFWQLFLVTAWVLVCLSRIYLGKHYPSQVVVGSLLGAMWGYCCGWLFCYAQREWAKKRSST